MTTNYASQFTPLIARWARRLTSQEVSLQEPSVIAEDPLPMFVRRRPDGAVVSRHTYITEVHTETTDDN